MRWSYIAVPAVLMAFTGACAAADIETKVGCVDMERVLAAHPETKEAEAILEKQIKEFEAEKEALLAKFDRLKKEFEQARAEAENKALSDAGRDKKRQEAEDKLIAWRDYEAEVRQTALTRQKQLADRKRRMRERIVEKIRTIIQTYAAKKGLVLVLDAGPMLDSPGMVVYSIPKMDITEDTLKIVAAQKVEKPAADAGSAAEAAKPTAAAKPAAGGAAGTGEKAAAPGTAATNKP